MKRKFILVILMLILAVVVGFLYWQARDFAFIPSDDIVYVYGEPQVTNGVTIAGLKWAFTTQNQTCNWHPITFISLMMDISLFGLKPGPMHIQNAIIHCFNSFLLLMFLTMILSSDQSLSKRNPRPKTRGDNLIYGVAFIGALVWSVHPLRAESVAWISSRKDVLCGFWYLLGHMAYLKGLVSYDQDGDFLSIRKTTFVLVLVMFVLAFMSKPTAITYPFTLLLMEYYIRRKCEAFRVWILMSIFMAFAIITVFAQQTAIAHEVSVIPRMMNAIACIGEYIRDTIFPLSLCLGYPYRIPVEFSRILPGVLILVVFFYMVIPFLKKLLKKAAFNKCFGISFRAEAPELSIYNLGIFWFMLTLLPTIGVLQVGSASRADRYTYLPAIGLSIILISIIQVACQKTKVSRIITGVGSLIAILFLVILGYQQVSYWRNTVSVFSHAINVSHGNLFAYKNLAVWYVYEKKYEEALKVCIEMSYHGSLNACLPTIQPVLFSALNAKGKQVESQQEILSYNISPEDLLAFEKNYLFAYIACCRGLYSSAEVFLDMALQLNPENISALKLEAQILFMKGNAEFAAQKLILLKKKYPKALYIEEWLYFVKNAQMIDKSF